MTAKVKEDNPAWESVRVVMADKDMVEEMWSVSSWRARTWWRRCGPCRHGGQGHGGGDVFR
ncbi:hypothetical protein LSAT2_020044, partial [Lamellibrachia satsuma]